MQQRRPPSLLPCCRVLPCSSSFPHFERDPRGPSKSPCSDIAALRDRLPTGGKVAHRIMPRYFWDTILGLLCSLLGYQFSQKVLYRLAEPCELDAILPRDCGFLKGSFLQHFGVDFDRPVRFR
jgi:hypothetical protein